MPPVPGPWWVWALGALVLLGVLYGSAPRAAGWWLLVIVLASVAVLKQRGVI
jgi:hypothetical protein